MHWINVFMYYLKGIFRAPVSDEVFKSTLEQALELIEPPSFIPRNLIESFDQGSDAIDFGNLFDPSDKEKLRQEEERWRQIAEAYATHSSRAFAAYDLLRRIKPHRAHQRLHIQAILTMRVYIRTLNAHTMIWYTNAVPWGDNQVMERHFRYRDDARFGDSAIYKEAVKLESLLKESSLALKVPNGLDRVAFSPPLRDLLS